MLCLQKKIFITSQRRHRRYTPEYRAEVTRLVIGSGQPIIKVAAELGVSAGLLGKWAEQEWQRQGNEGGLSETDPRSKNARLRRKLVEPRLDNEFLLEVTVFLAAKQRERKSFD